MGNLFICCYTRRENLKTQFDTDDFTQSDGPTAKFLPYLERNPEKESVSPTTVSPTTVIPKTPSVTSSDVSTSILNSQPTPDKPANKSTLKVKDGHLMTRAFSAPVLHDVPDIVVTDHKGSMTEKLKRRFGDPSGEGKALSTVDGEPSGEGKTLSTVDGDEPSVSTDSFIMPSSICDESKTDRTPSVSPTLSRKSSYLTKSRHESAKEVFNAFATVSIASTMLDSRQTNQDNRNFEKDVKSSKRTNSLLKYHRGNEIKSRMERDRRMSYDRRQENKALKYGQTSSTKKMVRKKSRSLIK